jgi:hypothetical protein
VRWPMLKSCEDATIEGLIALWPEIHVRRSSIFDAVVEMSDRQNGIPVGPDLSRPSPIYRPSNEAHLNAAPKKAVRERRATYKKRTSHEATQENLWG